jgi:NADPH:quinone reductase-like Zn-dependent oxidoreductase
MRAIVRTRYGSPPDGLELREVEKPTVGEDEVLVRVRASSVNPVDWHGVTGTPYIARLLDGCVGRRARPLESTSPEWLRRSART